MSIRSIVAVWTLALLAAAGAIACVLTSDHITGAAPTIALAVPTGLAFIASGIVARTRRPQNGTGVLLILVGFSWFLAALPTSDQPHLFTIGALLNGLFIGFLAHLLLAFPSGRLTTRFERFVAVAMYVVVAFLPLFVLLFDEGEVSSSFCERGTCPDNLLATVPEQAVANVLAFFYGIGAGLLSITVAVLLIRRWRRASPALRSALNPIVLAAGLLIATFAVQIVASGFSERAARAVNWALLTAMLALPLAFLYGLLRPRLTASSRRLAAELAEQRRPEEIQDVLRRALRDPTLELGYLTATKHGYVDVDGETLRLPGPDSGRTVTDIGQEIIVHDSALADQPELDEVVDAARLALERGLSLRSLEATERRESALLDAIPDNVYRTSADGVLLEAHVKDDGVEGKFAQGVVGRRIGDVLPAELTDLVMDGVHRALQTGEAVTIEYSVESPEGVQHLEERIMRSGDDEAVGIVRDVTERKRQERELQALAEEQAALSRVAVAVATERRPEALFNVVTEEIASLFGARWASMVRYVDANDVLVVGEWHTGEDFELQLGYRFPLAGGAISQAKETGRTARIVYQLEQDGPWREMVAAPIVVTGRIWGAATISLPAPDSFPADVEERLAKFTRLLAVSLANAEAREQLSGLAEEQAALSRVAVAVATERPQRVFDVVSEEVGRLCRAQGANLARYEQDPGSALVVGSWESAPGANVQKGHRVALDGPTPVALVRRTGRPVRVDSFEGMEGTTAARIRELGVGSAAAAPVDVAGRRWGAVVVTNSEPAAFDVEAEERLAKFASLVAVAIANAEAYEELTASRARIVRAGDEERSRLERNLHDGAQQRLVALSLALRLVESRLDTDPAGAREMLEASAEELTLALEELRELARGIHPAILTNRGLPAALEALATRAPVPVELHSVCQDRLPPSVEAAAYYVVAESLTNVAKYAQASAAQVSVTRRDGVAIVEVEDDGVGGADATQGSGLRGLADRVESLEGRLDIESTPGRGTRVRAEIPIAAD